MIVNILRGKNRQNPAIKTTCWHLFVFDSLLDRSDFVACNSFMISQFSQGLGDFPAHI